MKEKSLNVNKGAIALGVVTVIMVIIAVSLAISTQLRKSVATKILEIANSKKQEVMANNEANGVENTTNPSENGSNENGNSAGLENYGKDAQIANYATQKAPVTSNWDMDKVHIEYDTENIAVPVPNGYVGSSATGEHTINTGFVIYEGTDAVTDENLETAQKKRNQWVWVPVYDASTMYGVDSDGKMWGKLYKYGANGRTAYNWSETDGIMKKISYIDGMEPNIVEMYDRDYYIPNYITEEECNQINKEMVIAFEETIESIEKYGGFYIGRYETGGISTTSKVVKGNEDISEQTWYKMYNQCKKLNGINNNVKTEMIYGCMWDYTLEWFVETGSKTYSEVGKDSTEWGNYTNSSVNGHGSIRPSGYSESWKANNIYDMSGNIREWTLEAYGKYYRTHRGGAYCDYGTNNAPGEHQMYFPSRNYIQHGCRATLYIDL